VSGKGSQTRRSECQQNLHIEGCVHDWCISTEHDGIGVSVFKRTHHDDKLGLSVEDRAFLQIMDKGFSKDYQGR